MQADALLSLGFGKEVSTNEPQILITQREGIFISNIQQKGEQIPECPSFEKATFAKYSPDGKLLAVVSETQVSLCCTTNGLILAVIPRSNIELVDFSPRSTYLTMIEKYKNEPNMHVINLSSNASIVGSIEAKGHCPTSFKNAKWKQDESVFARLVGGNKIEIYEPSLGFKAPARVINLDLIHGFEINPAADCSLIAVTTFAINKPEDGVVRFFDYHKVDKEKYRVKAYEMQDITVKFSPDGTAALLWYQTHIDVTGKSYYGQHELHYTQCIGGTKRCQVPIFDNQISDVQWSPDGQDFIVISGLQPAIATLFTKDCVPIFEFGKSYRNTIRYSPFGNFVIIAGFGNLVGDMDFWDKTSFELLGKAKSHCAVICEWSPNGKYILTGVAHPRVRVDNEFKVFRYNGDLLFKKDLKHTQLFGVEWQPTAKGEFIQPDTSPNSKKKVGQEHEKAIKAASVTSFKPHWHSSELSSLLKSDLGAKVSGPRKLNGDEYKHLLEKKEERKQQAPKVQSPDRPMEKISWRNTGEKAFSQANNNTYASEVAVTLEGQKAKKKRGKKKKKEGEDGDVNGGDGLKY